MSFTRNQKRQIQKLAVRVDRELDNDRRYFQRHPERTTYIRRPYPAERESAYVAGTAIRGHAEEMYVLVHQVSPGNRLRGFIRSPAGLETDLSEEEARGLWDKYAAIHPRVAEIYSLMRQVAGRMRAGGSH